MENLYRLSISFFNSFFLFLLFTGCASPYRQIEPQQMVYHATPDTLRDCNVEITYRYNILENASNRKYVRMEKRSGISLLAVRIANYGHDTLYIPDDILIEARQSRVFPLEMDEAIDVFIQNESAIVNEVSGAANIQVNAGWGWVIPIAVSIPSMINASVETKANNRFINEMLDYYLVESNIPPGSTVSGLIALPVVSNTPLTFKKK